MISPKKLSVLALVIAAGSYSLAALAQNVVPNPDFATDTASWAKSTGGATATLTWDGADGSPANGSALIADTANPGNVAAATTPCTSITNGNFDFFARIKPAAGTTVTVLVDFFLTQCDLLHGISSTNIPTFPTSLANGWFEGSLLNQVPPVNSPLKAQFRVIAFNSSGPASAHFDHLRYGPTGTVPVELQTFEVE